MAKQAKQKEEVKAQESEAAATDASAVEAPAAAPAAKAVPAGFLPIVGDMVHFYRKQNSGNSTKHEVLAGLVIGYPPAASNYQAKDFAVKLKVITEHGDQIKEAMFDVTGQKLEHRWGIRS